MQVSGVSTSSVSTTSSAIAPPKPETASTPADTKPAAIQPKHDTVELTGAALAKSLKLSGQNAAQIALKMGVDIKTVDSYLSIKAPTNTPVTPAPQAKPAATVAAVAQTYSPAEEAKEPASEKATETAQGKK